jgi:hypothetical protein
MTYFDKSKEIGVWQDGTFVVKQKIKAPPTKNRSSDEDSAFELEQEENLFAPEENPGFELEQEDNFFEPEEFPAETEEDESTAQ